MAVSLPSDLILDVMRNADPGRLAAATSKLQSISDRGVSTDFARLLNGPDAAAFQPESSALALAGDPAEAPPRAAAQEPYVEFERMVLRNLLHSLLPDASSGAFGTGPSAGVWRSLAADQLAGLYADAGGAGIARALSSDDQERAADQLPQWPYFSSRNIEAFVG